MREIECRAWDESNHKMLYEGKEQWHQSGDRFYYCSPYSIPYGYPSFKPKLVWLEYTGLKDKNGKKIYEGDVLKVKTVYEKATTSNSEYGRYFVDDMWGLRIRLEHPDTGYRFDNDIEIVGNVYENPEILK